MVKSRLEDQQAWRARNPAKVRAYAVKSRGYIKEWRKRNPEKVKAYSAKQKAKGYKRKYTEVQKERYRKYQKEHPEASRKGGARLREKRRSFLNELKTKPCMDCGNSFPPECMDFDHVRGTKNLGIYQMYTRAMPLLMEEIAKCDLVCANCHRVRTMSRKRPIWNRAK